MDLAKAPEKLAYWLEKDLNKAIYDFGMIKEGGRVAVAVSGGVDSLTLLSLLDHRRKHVPEKYQIVAIHVSGDARGNSIQEHPALTEWLRRSKIDFHFVPMMLPEDESLPLNCHRCSRNRKRTIFETAKQAGFNVVAYGHHADDLAETTLLNLLFHGRLETMSPVGDYFNGTFKLIRPMCYLLKHNIARFGKACGFPAPPPTCPNSDTTQREVVRNLIGELAKRNPDVKTNLLRAGLAGIGAQLER